MSRQIKGKKYDTVALYRAIDAVKSKSMGYFKASKVFGVPRTTIFDKIKGNSDVCSRQGPNTVLSPTEEGRLAKWLVEMSKIGYGRTKHELLETVQLILKADGRKNPFKNDKPGKDWYYGYMKRHPEIALRSPRQLGKERAIIKAEQVEKWFTDFEAYIIEKTGSDEILHDPARIYNADESGFSLCPNTGLVLGLKGAKSIYNLTASDRSQITVLAGMSAAAHYLRPMIVFPVQRFSKNMLEGFEEAVMGRSDNGWMDSELFVEWLKTVFIPDINDRKVRKPVILLVDGHRTRLTMEASDTCVENDIILYCLLEHASHLMQPCDLQLFGTLKDTWKTSLREWQIKHVGQYVTKYDFSKIFQKAWVNASRVEVAVKGFKDAGIYPLNKEAVLKTDKLQTSKLFESDGPMTCDVDTNKVGTILTKQTPSNDKLSPDVTRDSHTVRGTREENINNNKKDGISNESAINEGQSQSVNLEGEHSPFSRVLKVPKPQRLVTRINRRDVLPKAVTGEEFRSILAKKKQKREEEEKAKEDRKRERIQKREEKEKLKKERTELKVKKINERKRKMARIKRQREVVRKLKEIEKNPKGHHTDIESQSEV